MRKKLFGGCLAVMYSALLSLPIPALASDRLANAVPVLALLLLSLPTPALASDVILTVTERFGVDREAAPVTYGVPFSREDNLLSADSLQIPDTQTQFRVLSRYEGTPEDKTRPIRMVLVDFQTDIKASDTRRFILRRHDRPLDAPTITRIATSDPRVEIRGPVAQGSDMPGGLRPSLARTTTDGVEIDTGPASFRISRTKGNLFEQVLVNNSPLIQSPTGDGFHIVFNGQTYSSSNIAPFNLEIEENGPLRSVVKVEGEFADASGNKLIPPPTRVGTVPDTPLRYTIRYFAYKDKGYLKLQVTLRNENKGWTYQPERPVHNIHITEAYLKTTLDGLAQTKTVAFDGYTDTFTSGTYSILQREVSDGTKPLYDWQYAITRNGQTVSNGEQYDSYVNLRDQAKGLMVANRWFWQNHPMGVTVRDNELHMNLWPNARDYRWPPNDGTTHRILGGIWKTHEILYSFHGPETNFSQDLAHIKKRLIARCSDEYYAKTEFFPFLAPAKVTSDYTFPAGETLQSALDAHSNRHRALFDSAYIQNRHAPNTIFDMRDGRKVKLTADPDNYATWYGWLEFGGMPRAANFGYHNQHYDWSYLALMGFLRFTDYNMFEIAEEFLNHKADILTIHDPDAKAGDGTLRYEYHGGQRYEQDALFTYHDDHGPSNSAPRKASHLWTSGLTLQYLLTGEHIYYDAVQQSYEHIMRVRNSPTMKDAETRNSFRGIDVLLNGYLLEGNQAYLDVAYEIFVQNLLVREGGAGANDGSSGWIQGGFPGTVGVGGDSWQIEPFIKLHIALLAAGKRKHADNLRDFFYRWSNWARDTLWSILPHGSYRNEKTEYFPYVVHSVWNIDTNTFSGVVDAEHSVGYANLFIYRSLMESSSARDVWLDLARSIFKDFFYYGNIANWTGTRSTINEYPHGAPGFYDAPGSGHWKVSKAIIAPMSYKFIEGHKHALNKN